MNNCEILFHLGQQSRKSCRLKIILFLALMAILFGGAEPVAFGKSATIRESNHGSGVYIRSITCGTMNQKAPFC